MFHQPESMKASLKMEQQNERSNAITIDVDDVLESNVEQTKDVVLVRDDDGKPSVGFIIVSKDSKQYRDKAKLLRSNGIRRQANKRTRIDTKTEDGALAFGEIVEENEYELAVAVVVGYFGLTSKGKPVPFSEDMTRKLFNAKPSWREAVSAALEEQDGFLKLSSTNSAISRAANSASEDEERTD